MEMDNDTLFLSCLVPSSAVSRSLEMTTRDGPGSFLVYSCGNTMYSVRVSFPRKIVSQMNFKGNVICLRQVRGGLAVLVIYSSHGEQGFCLVENPECFKQVYVSPVSFPACAGTMLDTPISSNECEDLLVVQVCEGSVHILFDLLQPQCRAFTLPSSGTMSPIRSMALMCRGATNWALAAIFGDDAFNTEFAMFEIQRKNVHIEIDRIQKIPPIFSSFQHRPYSLFYNSISSSLLLLGGDCVKFSTVAIVDFASIFASKSSSLVFNHCQPMPSPIISAMGADFVAVTAFGDVFKISKKSTVMLVPPVCLAPNGASTVTTFRAGIFVGQTMGDSVFINIDSGPLTTIVKGVGPVLDMGVREKDVFFVSGYGKTSAINRVYTNSVAAYTAVANVVTAGALFCLGSEIVVSHALGTSRADLPPNLLGLFEFQNNLIYVTIGGVFGNGVLLWAAAPITVCAVSVHAGLLALACANTVYTFSLVEKRAKIVHAGSEEVAAMAVWENMIAVAFWDGSLCTLQNDGLFSIASGDIVPRSIWLGQEAGHLICAVGFANGAFHVYKDSTLVFSLEAGTLPVSDIHYALLENTAVLFISGSRPGVFVLDSLTFRDIVLDGELAVLRRCAARSGQDFWCWSDDLRLITLEAVSTAHVHARLLGSEDAAVPLAVAVCGSTLAIAKLPGTLEICDGNNLAKLGEFTFSENYQITCMTKKDSFSLLFGTACGDLLLVSLVPVIAVVKRFEACCSGAVLGLAMLSSQFVAAIAERSLYILSSGHQTVAQMETAFMAVTVRATFDGEVWHILVGDVARSQALFAWDGYTLTQTAADCAPSSCVSAEIMDDLSCLLGDDGGNLFISRPDEQGRLVRRYGANLGESAVTALGVMPNRSCWIGTRNGSVWCLDTHERTNERSQWDPVFPADPTIATLHS